MNIYKNTYNITLPNSPKWHIVDYENLDNQPDYLYHLDKCHEFKKNLYEICLFNYKLGKTNLEYYIQKKRYKLNGLRGF